MYAYPSSCFLISFTVQITMWNVLALGNIKLLEFSLCISVACIVYN